MNDNVKSIGAKLDALDNLAVRIRSKTKTRRTIGGRNDELTKELASANAPSEMLAVAVKYGIDPTDVYERGKGAPNFGQFRMVIGNRIRGVINRVAAARSKGTKMTYAEAASSSRLKGETKPKVKVIQAQSKRKKGKGVQKPRVRTTGDERVLSIDSANNEAEASNFRIRNVKSFKNAEAAEAHLHSLKSPVSRKAGEPGLFLLDTGSGVDVAAFDGAEAASTVARKPKAVVKGAKAVVKKAPVVSAQSNEQQSA